MMTRNFHTLVLLAAFVGPGCSSSGPAADGGSGGGTGGEGSSALPKPPVLGGDDGLCASTEERVVSTCEWAAAAERIVWAKVKSFELLMEPSFIEIRKEPGWAFTEECDLVYASGALTLTVLEDLQGSGADEVTVLLSPGALGHLVFERDSDGRFEALGSADAGFVAGQEFGLALHQPEGSDQWFAPREQLFPLDGEGKLAWPWDGECGLHMPPVLSGGTMEELREELEECEGSNADPWLEQWSAEVMLIYHGTARCSEGTPAMGGAGGDSSAR